MGTNLDYEGMPALNYCVVIPTYNNHKTLQRVIDGVLCYTHNVIIINDGSTDTTKSILDGYPQLTVLHLPVNKGKGNALRAGFAIARNKGYEYAITLDSDGQHYPNDIPVFLEAVKNAGNTLYIGSRDLQQDGVPKKNSFGNGVSNFWYRFVTGLRLNDTQSGFRIYPLRHIPQKLYTNKFELETEVLVRSCWRGVPVVNIPVKVLYDPAERVSHFRPFLDIMRIIMLHTLFVAISFAYIKPRNAIRSIRQKNLKTFFIENVLESGDTPARKAMSIALGVFVGIVPAWGFQTLLVFFLAYILKLNKLIAFAFSNISIPPMIPFIILASLKTGSFFVPETHPVHNNTFSIANIQENLAQYLVGSFVLAVVLSFIFGATSYIMLSSVQKSKVHKNA